MARSTVKGLLNDDNIFFQFVDTSVLTFLAEDLRVAPGQKPHHSREVSYSTVKAPDLVTGVRSDSMRSGSVVITASTVLPNGETAASCVRGSIAGPAQLTR